MKMQFVGGLFMACLFACRVYDEELGKPAAQGGEGIRRSDTTSADSGAAVAAVGAETRCGDGVISGPEKCDTGIAPGAPGACPSSCPPLAPCAQRALNGSACQAECVLLELVCGARDACCPSRCEPALDVDCSPACGNGVIDVELGETCEANTSTPCPTRDADCDDADACTQDRISGSAENCNAVCTHAPIVALSSGDGCCPANARASDDADCRARCDSDAGEGCSSAAPSTQTPEQLRCLESANSACQRCSCEKCTREYLACRSGESAEANRLCSAVIDCAERAHCIGDACYCGPAGPPCAFPGPCQREIAAASGTLDPLLIRAASHDPATPVGHASAVDVCRVAQCRDECANNTNN